MRAAATREALTQILWLSMLRIRFLKSVILSSFDSQPFRRRVDIFGYCPELVHYQKLI